MVKAIKFICIAGILVLLVLFVIFTGDSRSSSQNPITKKVYKEQSIKPHKSKSNSKTKVNIDAEPDLFQFNIHL